MVWGSNPSGGEIFRTCPDHPCGPPSLLYNGYRVFQEGKDRPGRDVDPWPPSSAVVMKGFSYTSTPPVDRTACTEPVQGSVPVQGCNLPCRFFLVQLFIYPHDKNIPASSITSNETNGWILATHAFKSFRLKSQLGEVQEWLKCDIFGLTLRSKYREEFKISFGLLLTFDVGVSVHR